MRKPRASSLAISLVATFTASSAHAQFVATPYIDTNVAGDVQSGRAGIGLAGAYYLRGRIGVEMDVEWHPHFFKDADVNDLVPADVDLNTNATLVMGNIIAPFCFTGAAGAWCPYGTAGIGVIHAVFDAVQVNASAEQGRYDDKAQDDLTLNVGVGVMHALTSLVGFRVDLRYFHALVDEQMATGGYLKDYRFWRASVGITFGFPR